jgi:DNA replicative helicase MCM subunit Mcm2 (Cdc46/Mcm family)
MIKEIYLKLRESSVTAGGINITPRHLESAIRICEGTKVVI